jgi:hypothetical protein
LLVIESWLASNGSSDSTTFGSGTFENCATSPVSSAALSEGLKRNFGRKKTPLNFHLEGCVRWSSFACRNSLHAFIFRLAIREITGSFVDGQVGRAEHNFYQDARKAPSFRAGMDSAAGQAGTKSIRA